MSVIISQQQYFETVLEKLKQEYEVNQEIIETVTSTQTSSGNMYTIVVLNKDHPDELYQIDLFYDSTT